MPPLPVRRSSGMRDEGGKGPKMCGRTFRLWSRFAFAKSIYHPFSISAPLRGCSSDLAQVHLHSNTPARNASRSDAGGPSLRVAGFEDEEDDEDEYEAPCEGGFKQVPGVKTPGLVLFPLRGRNVEIRTSRQKLHLVVRY